MLLAFVHYTVAPRMHVTAYHRLLTGYNANLPFLSDAPLSYYAVNDTYTSSVRYQCLPCVLPPRVARYWEQVGTRQRLVHGELL